MLTIDVLQEHNRRLRDRVSELEETVRALEARIATSETEPLPDGVPSLTVLEERVLRSLLARKGVVERDTIFFETHGESSDVDIKIIDVIVCKLRRKLVGTEIKIATSWGRGYFIERATFRAAQLTSAVSGIAEAVAA